MARSSSDRAEVPEGQKEGVQGVDTFVPIGRVKLAPIITLAIFFVLWEFFVWASGISHIILPAPSAAFKYIYVNYALLWTHTLDTTTEVVLGFLLSVAVGLFIAVIMIHFKLINDALYPLIIMSQVLPKIAFAPLLLLWLGYGMLPKVVIAFTVAFFPIVINSIGGFTSVDPEMLDLLRVLRANKWQIFFKLRLKNALPQMFDGFKIAITLAVIGAIVAEFIGAETGLGYLIIVSNSTLDSALMFASLIILSVAGVALFGFIMLIERFSIPWNFRA